MNGPQMLEEHVGELITSMGAFFPGERVVYHRNQVHFAPTHSVELAVFNPATGEDQAIYPPNPAQPVRREFVRRVAAAYQQRGQQWFREYNHPMDPEMFDSTLATDISVNAATGTFSFRVRYGSLDNANDPIDFAENVLVTCRIRTLQCMEQAIP